ncbi:MAG: hypothetical protein ACI8W8_002100 [Rhodothermales bacterium]|jgi:hypothetical protein
MAKVKLKTSRNRGSTATPRSASSGGGGDAADRRTHAREEGRKRKRIGLIITLIVFFCIFLIAAAVGGVIVAGLVPNNPDDLKAMYLKKVELSQERADYLEIEDYFDKADRYSKDMSALDKVATLCANFEKNYPQSIFVVSADKVPWSARFGLPEFLVEKHALFGPGICNSIPPTLANYDELLARLQRSEERKLEEDVLKERLEEKKRVEAEIALREAEMAKQAALAARRDQCNADTQRIRNEVRELLAKHEYDKARSAARSLFSYSNEESLKDCVAWGRRKARQVELAKEAYEVVYASNTSLNGETIQLVIGGRLRTVTVISFVKNEMKVSFRQWDPKEQLNKNFRIQVPVNKLPLVQYEQLYRAALEKEGRSGDFELLMAHSLYASGNLNRAREMAAVVGSDEANFLSDEIDQE